MQDVEYLKSMYPRDIRILQNYVSEACDYFEYKNSPMYDQCPDSLMISRLCDSICDTIIDAEGMDRLNENWGISTSGEKRIGSTQLESVINEIQNEAAGEQKKAENGPKEFWQEEQFVKIQEIYGQEHIQWRPAFQKERKNMQAEELMLPQRGWGPRPPHPWPPRPVPPHHRPPHNRPGGRPLWLRDIVNILLLNEMRDRRCERGICAWQNGQT